MTRKHLIRKLETTLKAYNKLWDRLENLEFDLDEADNDDGLTSEITGWGVSEMRDNLAGDVGRLESAIKALKKEHAAQIKKAMKKFHRPKS